MISRLPVFSGKMIGSRVAPEMVVPLVVLVVFLIAVLISYPWQFLSVGTLIYLVSLPVGWFTYREHERRAAQASASPSVPHAESGHPSLPPSAEAESDRPSRLN